MVNSVFVGRMQPISVWLYEGCDSEQQHMLSPHAEYVATCAKYKQPPRPLMLDGGRFVDRITSNKRHAHSHTKAVAPPRLLLAVSTTIPM